MNTKSIISQLRKQSRHLKDQLARTEAAIEALTGQGGAGDKGGRKRKMSAAARAKIAAAMRARWKKWKSAKKQ
jgi:hypothetical protein